MRIRPARRERNQSTGWVDSEVADTHQELQPVQRFATTERLHQTALKALGIRQHRLYDTRHIYATLCLVAGVNAAFIANPPGHTIEVLLSTYAERINCQGGWSELAKLSTDTDGKHRYSKIRNPD